MTHLLDTLFPRLETGDVILWTNSKVEHRSCWHAKEFFAVEVVFKTFGTVLSLGCFNFGGFRVERLAQRLLDYEGNILVYRPYWDLPANQRARFMQELLDDQRLTVDARSLGGQVLKSVSFFTRTEKPAPDEMCWHLLNLLARVGFPIAALRKDLSPSYFYKHPELFGQVWPNAVAYRRHEPGSSIISRAALATA